MVAPINPARQTSNGMDTWWWVPAIASLTAPTVAEINAAGGLNVSCFLLKDTEDPTSETERVTLPAALCETSTVEFLGDQKIALADMTFFMDPQAAAAADGKKAWALLKDGGPGFLVRRQNVIADQASPEATAGQFVDTFRVTTNKAVPGKTSTGADGVYKFTYAVGCTGFAFNVAVAA